MDKAEWEGKEVPIGCCRYGDTRLKANKLTEQTLKEEERIDDGVVYIRDLKRTQSWTNREE
jgi:hypothetical protein